MRHGMSDSKSQVLTQAVVASTMSAGLSVGPIGVAIRLWHKIVL